ncbi:PRELI domain containing protein 3B-like isoform X2 [Watersipora subatra]|uniref:PRELI domain containing protein 3B-like isoform X2 n=1 Tax=Watersipora subatra TaxID=2589382 RepID=UPI00355C2C61
MKLYSSEYTFEHSWETVAKAVWRKYPNPWNTNLIAIDVLNRHIDSQGRLESHRLLTTQFAIPSFVHTILGGNPTGYVSEVSIVDPKKKTVELNATNLILSDYLTVDERLVYSQHPANKDHTLLKQEAYITVRGVPLSGYLEGVIENQVECNAGKGRKAMEAVISTIKGEMEELAKTAQSVSKSAQNVLVSKALDHMKMVDGDTSF